MNNVNLIGRITNDLELKMTQGNKAYCRFCIAVKKDYKNKEGKYDADFIDCIAWEQRADFLSKYAGKGTLLSVVGKIQTSTYEKNGQKAKAYQIQANEVQILVNPAKEEKQEATQEEVDHIFGTENGTATAKEIASEPEDLFY